MIISYPRKNGIKYFQDNTVYLMADSATTAKYMSEVYPTYVLDSYVTENQRFSNDGQLYYAFYGPITRRTGWSGTTELTITTIEWQQQYGFAKVIKELKILASVSVVSGSTVVVTEDTQFNYLGGSGSTATVVIDGVSFIISNSGGNFVWDLGGLGEYNFGSGTTGSITVTVNGRLYTINFTRGSLLFSVIDSGLSPDYFTLPDGVSFSYNSGITTSFLVNTNLPWSITENINWLILSNLYGTGKTDVIGTVTYNGDNVTRSGLTYVTVDSGSIHETKSILMTQEAEPDYITVNKTGLTYSYSSGLTDTFIISTNLDWVLTESIDWIQFSNYSGTGTTTVTGTIVSGNTGEERSGLTTITTSLGSISLVMIQLSTPPVIIIDISANVGFNYSFAVNSLGQAWAWGFNDFGQLGDNTITSKSTPVAVCGGHTFTSITSGPSIIAIDNLGQAWGWGYNYYGSLGNNSVSGTNESTPVAVCGGHTFTAISAGSSHSLAIDNLGQAWAWGNGGQGRLGNNILGSQLTPVAVCGGHVFTKIDGGSNHSLALDNLGQVWVWGNNTNGRLGDNSVTSRRSPVAVCGGHTFTEISGGEIHSLAIDNLGQAWAWGGNNIGQLGDNTLTQKSTPVAVCGGHTFTTISAGNTHSLAIDNLGQAWAWGHNIYGQLGNNNTQSELTPVAVCGGHTFTKITSGSYYNIAIDNLGQAWGWGYNTTGQLGDNTTIDKLTPVRVCNL